MAMQNDDDNEVAGREQELNVDNPDQPREPDEDEMEEEPGNNEEAAANENEVPVALQNAPDERPMQGQARMNEVRIPVPIITSPWQADLDLNEKSGKMLWNEGTTPLTNKFNGYGKDVVRFLAAVLTRATMCHWANILMYNGKHLLKQYGDITLAEIEDARDARQNQHYYTLAAARPLVNAKMMFHFLYNSLGDLPQKKLSTMIDSIKEDGPVLLKMVLNQTFIATKASTFVIKEKFYDLQLKRYKWNVQMMNQDVREKMADLTAAGHSSDSTDMIISLFRAYKTATNEEFKTSVGYWKDSWTQGTIKTPEELMLKADEKYDELKTMGTWGRRGATDNQIVALTAKLKEFAEARKPGNSSNSGSSTKTPKWKFDRSLSQTESLVRNGKTYRWCQGPGHAPMWVVHVPGECTNNKAKSGAPPAQTAKQALTSLIKAQDAHIGDDELEGKLSTLLSVLID